MFHIGINAFFLTNIVNKSGSYPVRTTKVTDPVYQ